MIPDRETFKRTIYEYYKKHKRNLPWRSTKDPYKILVSEIMLQQTQVPRVCVKYGGFISVFPDFNTLHEAPLDAVLAEWQGMGYNRRAIYLKRIAGMVVEGFGGRLPEDPAVLETFPGIGVNTAASIAAFAYNLPVVFIETNIRTVFTAFFFKDKEKVKDKEILPLVEAFLDTQNPRDWYNALMDYGVMLKAEHGAINSKSSHYVKQKPFKGSNRETRGKILKTVTGRSGIGLYELAVILDENEDKVLTAAEQLSAEGFFTIHEGIIIMGHDKNVPGTRSTLRKERT